MDESDDDDGEVASCCLEQDVVKKIRPNWIVFLPVEHNITILATTRYTWVANKIPWCDISAKDSFCVAD